MPDLEQTLLKLEEQYRDRWGSLDEEAGILSISDRLRPQELKPIPIFKDYDDKFLEEISPDISLVTWAKDSVLFEEGTYLDLAFYIKSGAVDLYLEQQEKSVSIKEPIFDTSRTGRFEVSQQPAQEPEGTVWVDTADKQDTTEKTITYLCTMDFNLSPGETKLLATGDIFGEIGAMSGWPQSLTARTASECALVQIRVGALRKMRRRSKAFQSKLNEVYRERELFSQLKLIPILLDCDDSVIELLKEKVDLVSYEPGETIIKEAEPASEFFLVRSGFVKLSQRLAEGEIAVSYLSKGMTLGETELLSGERKEWSYRASSVEYCDLVKIPQGDFKSILKLSPEMERRLWKATIDRVKEVGANRADISRSEFINTALQRGLVQGTSIMVIDLDVCTRCDDCVRACTATHGGRARFVREGDKYENFQIAKSCYHCLDPVCLIGCPTGAIHRANVGETVEISDDLCIGCKACASNCPYDAIVMHDMEQAWPSDMVPKRLRDKPRIVASKCDLCHETGHEPACVSNCPHGCLNRTESIQEFQDLIQRHSQS